MFRAVAIVNGVEKTESFDYIGGAIQWVRGFGITASKFAVYDKDGDLYYGI